MRLVAIRSHHWANRFVRVLYHLAQYTRLLPILQMDIRKVFGADGRFRLALGRLAPRLADCAFFVEIGVRFGPTPTAWY